MLIIEGRAVFVMEAEQSSAATLPLFNYSVVKTLDGYNNMFSLCSMFWIKVYHGILSHFTQLTL